MKDIFCLWPQPQKGVPVFLDGVLSEQFDMDNPMAEHAYEWASIRGKKRIEFPDFLRLICREKLLLFDYHPFGSGFIVSKSFLAVLENHVEKENVPLKICSSSGHEITDKAYFYLRFLEKTNFINYSESKFHVKKDANADLVRKAGFGIDRFERIVTHLQICKILILSLSSVISIRMRNPGNKI